MFCWLDCTSLYEAVGMNFFMQWRYRAGIGSIDHVQCQDLPEGIIPTTIASDVI